MGLYINIFSSHILIHTSLGINFIFPLSQEVSDLHLFPLISKTKFLPVGHLVKQLFPSFIIHILYADLSVIANISVSEYGINLIIFSSVLYNTLFNITSINP